MISIRVFGALDVRGSDGRTIQEILSQPKRAGLLVYLALSVPRGSQRRDALVSMFWPEQDTERARNALSQALHFLRRSLGSSTVVNRNGDALGLEWSDVWCDA